MVCNIDIAERNEIGGTVVRTRDDVRTLFTKGHVFPGCWSWSLVRENGHLRLCIFYYKNAIAICKTQSGIAVKHQHCRIQNSVEGFLPFLGVESRFEFSKKYKTCSSKNDPGINVWLCKMHSS